MREHEKKKQRELENILMSVNDKHRYILLEKNKVID